MQVATLCGRFRLQDVKHPSQFGEMLAPQLAGDAFLGLLRGTDSHEMGSSCS